MNNQRVSINVLTSVFYSVKQALESLSCLSHRFDMQIEEKTEHYTLYSVTEIVATNKSFRRKLS